MINPLIGVPLAAVLLIAAWYCIVRPILWALCDIGDEVEDWWFWFRVNTLGINPRGWHVIARGNDYDEE